jgi:4-amino-4-deoxy-L-arabinose transferase-like glycosyltransferase
LTEFKADEARLLALALDMAEGQFALRGISSSVGFPNFPASVWIYSLPLFLWPHPFAATLFTGLLNTLAIAAAYWFVRRYWGITAALAATMMFAVSPWAVIFSRKIWAQNLLPLFVVGWAISAALALVEERPKFIWLHFLFLALAVQIHLAAVTLVPATAILLLIFRRRVHWRSLLVGLAVAALTIIPFAVYLGQVQGNIALPAAMEEHTSVSTTFDSIHFITMISLGTFIHSLAGPTAFTDFLALIPQMSPTYWIWGLLIIAGVFWLTWQAWNRWDEKPSQAGLIVLVWLFLPPVFFLWQITPVFLHYFIATMPAQYIAAGIAFSRIPHGLAHLWPAAGRGINQAVRVGAWIIFIATLISQFWVLVTLMDFLGRSATPGAFGVPLAMKLEAANHARALFAATDASEILVAGPGESPRLDAVPAEWDVLLRDMPHRFVNAERSALFPSTAVVVLLDERTGVPIATADLYQEAATSSQKIPLRPGEGSFTLLTLEGGGRPEPDVLIDPPYLLANWVNLLGHDQLQVLDGEKAFWQIHWRTGDNPDPTQYHFFNHLLDLNGERLWQVDEPAFAPWQWVAGDTVISRFLIPLPETTAPPLTMRVGMYHFPSLENVPLLDEAGNPYVDAATFSIDNNAIQSPK